MYICIYIYTLCVYIYNIARIIISNVFHIHIHIYIYIYLYVKYIGMIRRAIPGLGLGIAIGDCFLNTLHI